MNNEELKVGDLVQLKSGGPVMTVSEVTEPSTIICLWFPRSKEKGQDELQQGRFFVDTLVQHNKRPSQGLRADVI